MPVTSGPSENGPPHTTYECDRCGAWYMTPNGGPFEDAIIRYSDEPPSRVVTFIKVENDEQIEQFISDDDSNIFLCEDCTDDFKRFIEGDYVANISMGQAKNIKLPEIIKRYTLDD